MPMPVTIVVVLALIGCWGWVLGPSLLRTVFNRAHRDPVGHFNRQLNTLGQAPRSSAAFGSSAGSFGTGPRPGFAVRQRRRQIMLALVIAAAVSLVFAVVSGGIFVAQHIVLDIALIGYVVAAARAGTAEAERRTKVAYLGSNAEPARPTYLRTASGRR